MQLAVVIGKIARLDCPKLWPELLPTLVDAISTVSDDLRQQRILLSFYHVIKCLSARRLAHDRKVFEEVRCHMSFLKKPVDLVHTLYSVGMVIPCETAKNLGHPNISLHNSFRIFNLVLKYAAVYT